jgi:drug/metabolite transporter (DMT)-like permease
MNKQAWAAFWLVGAVWGSSYLFIRVALHDFQTAEIVFARTAIAAVGLLAVVWLRRIPYPKDWPTIRGMIIIGLGNVVAPFMLITWAEQFITSGLAAVLQSTAALFALVIAHFAFADERVSVKKIIGLILGFTGVVVLFSSEIGGENGIAGMLGMVGASLCYAIFTTYTRKIIQGNVAPVVISGTAVTVAAVVTAPLAFLSPDGFTPLATASSDSLIALVILGIVNTFVAYLFYYFIVRELGVSRASMVTYVIPPVGVILGALILHEPVGLPLILGGSLIFTGIAIVNLRLRRLRMASQESQA